jgi:ketosteroid isomerase-like protein
MTPKSWAVAAVCFTLAAGACQKPAEFTAADEATIKGMFDSTVVWYKARKFNEWSMLYAENGFLQPPNGKTLTGRAGLVAWANAFPPIEDITFTNVKVSGDGNMAMGSSDYTLKAKGAPADTGKQVVVARRGADGKWTVIGAGFSSDLPLAPVPAAPAKAAAKKK